MSFFTRLFPASDRTDETVAVDRGNSILSATGLSREALAILFRESGLFGAESDLAPVDQAVVQGRLGRLPGLRARPVLAPTNTRLMALEAFTDAVARAGGVSTAEQRRQLAEAGYSAAQISEVIRVVGIVRDVYGLSMAWRASAARPAPAVVPLALAA